MENIQNNLKYNMTRIRSLLAVIVLAIMMITLSVNRYTVLADNDEVVDDDNKVNSQNFRLAFTKLRQVKKIVMK